MAQIDISNLTKVNKERNIVHDQVYATYTVFENNGKKYLQIDTYGKPARENPEKISQSFQFDRKAATYLANLLIEEFGLKLD
ncbi:MAG: methionyl-tRNA formyltransferase [Clostridium sp.]|nr:methionyl-tRNA formyltransferase [Clostridium sp.]